MTIDRLCGWHGIDYMTGKDGKGYLTLGYWLVIVG